MLFNCATRPWMKKEIKRMQHFVDRCWKNIWMKRKGGPGQCQMEREGVNMFNIRRTWKVDSLETKIAKRSLERIGHVLRMDDNRMTKQVTMGWLKKDLNAVGRKSRRNTTINYWKRLLREASIDVDTIESLATDKKRWKHRCMMDHRRRVENEESKRKQNTMQVSSESGEENQELLCEWPDCNRKFNSKLGLVQHQRLAHKRLERKFQCPKCARTFKQQSNLSNHTKVCRGELDTCRWCHKKQSRSNIARHERNCKKKIESTTDRNDDASTNSGMETSTLQGERNTNEERERNRGTESETEQEITCKWPCCVCSRVVSKGGVQCSATGNWCHFKCAKVTYATVRKWKKAAREVWRCPSADH